MASSPLTHFNNGKKTKQKTCRMYNTQTIVLYNLGKFSPSKNNREMKTKVYF